MGVVFEHENVGLCVLRLNEFEEVYDRLLSKPQVVKYLPFKVHTSPDETLGFLSKLLTLKDVEVLTIRHAADPRLMGLFTVAKSGHSIALSIMVAPDRYSMGAGRWIGPPFCYWLLAHAGIWRLWSYTDIDNVGVANMLIKGGARCEGLMRRYAIHPNISNEPRDCWLWSFVR